MTFSPPSSPVTNGGPRRGRERSTDTPAAPSSVAHRSALIGGRSRSPSENREAFLASRSRQRTRSPEKEEYEPSRPEHAGRDLHELILRYLNQGSSQADQHRALRTVQLAIKTNPESVNSWSAPGTPLSAIVKAGRTDLARLFLRSRANPNDRDPKGVAPLHLATFDGNLELLRILITSRADVDASDRHGQSPLFFAPNREVCKVLIEKRADVNVLNRRGQSALHLAGRAGLQEVLSWLSARVTKQLVDLRDVHGATARNYAQQVVPATSAASRPEGRRGSTSASLTQANEQLPSVSELIDEGAAGASTATSDSRRGASGPRVVNRSAVAVASAAPVHAPVRPAPAPSEQKQRASPMSSVFSPDEGSMSPSTSQFGFGEAKQFRLFDADSAPNSTTNSICRGEDDLESPIDTRGADSEPIEELYDRAFGKEQIQALGESQTQNSLLEAAAAVATAAVATAAALEADKARAAAEAPQDVDDDARFCEVADEEAEQEVAEEEEEAEEEEAADNTKTDAAQGADWLDDLEEAF